MKTCSPAACGKVSLTISWARRASPARPSSSLGIVFVPMLPPISVATITKASQPKMAFLRCCALQRPARAAKFCFFTGAPWGGNGTLRIPHPPGPPSQGAYLSTRGTAWGPAGVWLLPLRPAVELAPERLLRRLRHALLEDRDERLGGERAQLLERHEHGRPVRVGLARLVERLPHPVEEQLDEGVGDAVGVARDALDDVERLVERDPEVDQRLAGPQQRRARDLEATLPQRHHDAELLRPHEQLGIGARAEALAQLGGVDHLRPLVLERREQRARERERLLGRAARAVHQVLDRREVVAVALELLDQAQPGDVLGPVVARARAHLGRGQKAPRLMRPDVPDGHAGLAGELVDRVLGGRLGHRNLILRCYM